MKGLLFVLVMMAACAVAGIIIGRIMPEKRADRRRGDLLALPEEDEQEPEPGQVRRPDNYRADTAPRKPR